jgi:hypothetical protein
VGSEMCIRDRGMSAADANMRELTVDLYETLEA